MKKRRRLANKMTIMVCAVLIAVSAFFYVPMEAHASSSISLSKDIDYDLNSNYNYRVNQNVDYLRIADFYDGTVSEDSLYKVNLVSNISILFDNNVLMQNVIMRYGLNHILHITPSVETSSYVYNTSRDLILTGEDLNASNLVNIIYIVRKASNVVVHADIDISVNVNSVEMLSDAESSDYQNGYDAGYSDGEDEGYGSGYSDGFADGEASVDVDSIYDEAYEAGRDSVDTQSYYDAGYDDGYEVAYSKGYDTGYDKGYDVAMKKVSQWGADTSEYPKLLKTYSADSYNKLASFYDDGRNRDFSIYQNLNTSFNINPNHTYKFTISFDSIDVLQNQDLDSRAYWDSKRFFIEIGGVRYTLKYNGSETVIFIPGYSLSDAVLIGVEFVDLNVVGNDYDAQELSFVYSGRVLKIFDCGPSGDTQNHIANQTDNLTNGYDSSQGNKVNSNLSSGLNEYQTAEDSLWATATNGMKDFTFFDIQSVPAMVTGISFVTATMTGWFNNAGGASGVGIVLSILFSVMLVAMVLGLYRWYQSKGGKG